jgi:Xaa-Pro aminopeptidase
MNEGYGHKSYANVKHGNMLPLLFSNPVLQKRRSELANALRPGQDLLVLFTAPQMKRSADGFFPHRPDSNFVYLTGYREASAAALLWRQKNGAVRFELFVLPRDARMEQWNGYRYGPARAKALTKADSCFEIAKLPEHIQRWLREELQPGLAPVVYSNASEHPELEAQLNSWLEDYTPSERRGERGIEGQLKIQPHVESMRLVKDATELSLMRRSSQLNVAAHRAVMELLRPGMYEYEIQAVLENHYRSQAGAEVAYGCICASGSNATVLHYHDNSARMKAGDLLLVDAGCEVDMYASDITRTLPVDGRFTPEQTAIMDLVMEAHTEALSQARKGRPYKAIHAASERALAQGLRDLKILKGSVESILKTQQHRRYFPHGTGHWLGLDVHDPCPYTDSKGESLKLAPGMVFTIEPGLYFRPEDDTVDRKWRGIGVRIEDDVVIGERQPEILTEGLPRSAAEIESFMSKRR